MFFQAHPPPPKKKILIYAIFIFLLYEIIDEKKKISMTFLTKKNQEQLQKWQQKHESLSKSQIKTEEPPKKPNVSLHFIHCLHVPFQRCFLFLSKLPTIQELNDMFADTHQLICRLCQRQFKSQEILSKHISASDLHKQNLENHIEQLRKEQGSEDGLEDVEQKHYRDRAEERRKVFKDSDVPPGLHRANEERAVFEQSRPPEVGLGPRAEIGAKLLQQMGWSEGERLGKHKSGLQVPVEVQLRPSGLGLGAESTHILPSVSNLPDSYKETVKASARSRFEHLQRGEIDFSSRGPVSSDPEDESIPSRAGLGS